MKFRVYKILKHTKVEGPGIRYCIWFQGCSKRCKGCWAKATWDFKKGIEYDTNGNIEFQGEYLNGKRWNGKGYNYEGEESYIINYGNSNGKIIEYHIDGRKKYEGEYINGKKKWKRKKIL